MAIQINHIAPEKKWEMAAKGLTGALMAHLNALYSILGEEKYNEIIGQIWTAIGQGSAAEIQSLELKLDDSKSVAEAGVTMCICAMGPEYKISEIESSENRTVMKITECPWKKRMDEFGISQDLLSVCDKAFWKQFVKDLNPEITMRHGKQMHRGDAYCEWIFEKRG